MPIIKLKTGTTTPGSGSLNQGEIAHNTSANQVHIGNSSGNPVKLIGGVASQQSTNVALTGGNITVPTLTATTAKSSSLTWASGERLWYDEQLNASSYTGNWNYGTTTSMTQWGDLGSGTAHGWDGSARTYTLSLSGLPSHTQIRYQCYIHMVDSWDAEGYNTVSTSNSTSTGMLTQVQWYKSWTTGPYNWSNFNSTTSSWKANQLYSYSPWGTYYMQNGFQGSGSNQPGGNGYLQVDTGWYSHTASTFTASHYTPLDQAITDEAFYISHVKVWLNGGASTAVTSIPTSLTYDATTLPTQAAVKAFIDGNYAQTLKNLYTFTSNGTYNKSGSDVKMLRVICVGAGGGGRGYHESGGAGGYTERVIEATQISSISVTVGGGTGGGYYFGFSGQGGTTSFGSYCSAAGGHGANQNRSHAGGHGGLGYGGNINMYGGGGGGHAPGYNNQQGGESGQGGASFFGGGSQGRHGGHGYSDAMAPGGGAFGGAGNHNGGTGGGGICLVYEYR